MQAFGSEMPYCSRLQKIGLYIRREKTASANDLLFRFTRTLRWRALGMTGAVRVAASIPNNSDQSAVLSDLEDTRLVRGLQKSKRASVSIAASTKNQHEPASHLPSMIYLTAMKIFHDISFFFKNSL
jgi:hypothetical protein